MEEDIHRLVVLGETLILHMMAEVRTVEVPMAVAVLMGGVHTAEVPTITFQCIREQAHQHLPLLHHHLPWHLRRLHSHSR